MNKLVFDALKIGDVFKAGRNDIVGKGPVARIVRNDSTYIKTGNNASVDLRTNNDCIFRLDMPVKLITSRMGVQVEHMESYKISCKGGH